MMNPDFILLFVILYYIGDCFHDAPIIRLEQHVQVVSPKWDWHEWSSFRDFIVWTMTAKLCFNIWEEWWMLFWVWGLAGSWRWTLKQVLLNEIRKDKPGFYHLGKNFWDRIGASWPVGFTWLKITLTISISILWLLDL